MFTLARASNLLWGIGALDNKQYLPEDGLLASNLTFWGWLSIIWALMALTGAFLLFTRNPYSAGVALILAALNALFWLCAIPVLPIWSLIVIAIDVLIIYTSCRPIWTWSTADHGVTGGPPPAAAVVVWRKMPRSSSVVSNPTWCPLFANVTVRAWGMSRFRRAHERRKNGGLSAASMIVTGTAMPASCVSSTCSPPPDAKSSKTPAEFSRSFSRRSAGTFSNADPPVE